LCGVEQELINRKQSQGSGRPLYSPDEKLRARAKAVGSGFEMTPSPGNMRDGLLTDAMKSAGAARKPEPTAFCSRTVASHQVNKAVGHFLAIAAVDQFLLDAAQFRKLRKDASAA